MFAEIEYREVPEGTAIVPSDTTNLMPTLTDMEDGLYKITGEDPSLNRIDTIVNNLLKNTDINTNFAICLSKDGQIIERSKTLTESMLGIIQTPIIPIRTDSNLGIQLVLFNPYYIVFKRLSLLIIASLIIALLILGCIIKQIQIIRTQNRIAQIRRDFSHAMVHSMKNPLCSIRMCAVSLRSGKLDNKPETKEQYFNLIDNECERLLKLTENILTQAKLEEKKVQMEKKTIPLAPLIKELTEPLQLNCRKPLHIETDLQAHAVFADEAHLKEAIGNLLDNAVKYSKEEIRLQISSQAEKTYTLIRVHDNGIGIAQKDQAVIFDKFERASAVRRSPAHKGKGFGLGLNYVRQVAEAHGGSVAVNSIPGKYSEFMIYLPNITEEL